MRLSQYLKSKHKDLSNRVLKRALEQGACTINDKIERYASRNIDPKRDKIVFRYIKPKAKAKLSIQKSRIVYQDDDLLIYDKEAGHPTMATEGKREANLHSELKKYTKLKFLEPVHRLDKDTSGLIIFVKNRAALTELNRQFKAKEVKKEYQALVDGKWTKAKKGCIKNHLKLKVKKGAMQEWQVAKLGAQGSGLRTKEAITKYELIKSHKNYSHVSLMPETGRTHQLRVHMAYLGHPILGDTVYAESFKSRILVSRHLLHASKLKFKHPKTKKWLRLQSDAKIFNIPTL